MNKRNVEVQDRSKFCHFHKSHGHTTEESWQLKDEIETLIQRGALTRFVRREQEGQRLQNESERSKDPDESVKGVIHTIFGSLASGDDSRSAWRRYARKKHDLEQQMEDERPSRSAARAERAIVFADDYLKGVISPYDDALVIAANIFGFDVERILVDTGSLAKVIYLKVFEKMGLNRRILVPLKTPLTGFGPDVVYPLETVRFSMRSGEPGRSRMEEIEFIVVDL